MAIFTPGPLAGQISGRVGASVFSHNRGGTYIRNGTIPITSTTPSALAAKARLAAASQAWGSLTDGERLAWKLYAMENPTTNRLGRQIFLTGHQMFVKLNTRILLATDTVLTAPSLLAPPDPLLTFSITGDIGAGTIICTFTATPVGADDRLWIYGTVQSSSSIEHVKNLTRHVVATAKNQATGYDYQAALEAVFGTLIVGQQVTLFASVFSSLSGRLSAPLRATVAVSTT